MGAAASSDFRDGAASGAFELSKRLKQIAHMGVGLTDQIIDQVAKQIGEEYGGRVYTNG